MSTKKVTDDIDKLVKEGTVPENFIVVCGGRVSVANRKSIRIYANQEGIQSVEVWSGAEFEEKLRRQAPDVLQRLYMAKNFQNCVFWLKKPR